MKNKILLSLIASCMISDAAMADMFVGVEYGMAINETTIEDDYDSFKGDNDYNDIKFKFGAGSDGGFKGQVTLSLISFDETVFDDENSDLIEIGMDVIKEFEVTKNFYPFLKIGMGVGSMDVEGYEDSSILEVSFNVGAGVSYKAIENLYILGGVDYIGRKWQDIEYKTCSRYFCSTNTIVTTDSGFKPYIGLNYKF